VDTDTVAIYERDAERWAGRRGSARDDLALRFRRKVGRGPILDAGCGTGRYLNQIGPSAVGLDATAAMLHLARTGGKPLVRGDLEALPFATGCFAGVFARHSYLHLPKNRLGTAAAEAARVVRPGGLVMMSMIQGDYEGRALPGDDFPGRWFSLWTESELTATLTTAGFANLRAEQTERRYGSSDLVITGSRA
jgi:SAM-dependent methyltransferase